MVTAMFKGASFLVFSILFAVFFTRAEAADKSIPDFAPGQEWSIKSTPPTTAKVIIGRVEKLRIGIAVHVSIVNIPVPQGISGAGGTISIGHVAFEKSALSASVERVLANGISPSSSFETGYKQWTDEHGDLSRNTVPQVIAFGLAAMNRIR